VRFTYPDGPHDVEALAVDPTGALVLVTKGRTPTIQLFEIAAPDVAAAVAGDRAVTLESGRILPIVPDWALDRVVTGASMDPAGTRLAVRTYTELYFFPWPLPDPLPAAPASCFLGDLDHSGEAVAWEGPGGALLLTSEADRFAPGTLLRVRCLLGEESPRER
jgi:hypothetical protein